MPDCTCEIQDGHLVPCPEAERLFDDLCNAAYWDVEDYHHSEESSMPDMATYRRAYEGHIIAATVRLVFGRQQEFNRTIMAIIEQLLPSPQQLGEVDWKHIPAGAKATILTAYADLGYPPPEHLKP